MVGLRQLHLLLLASSFVSSTSPLSLLFSCSVNVSSSTYYHARHKTYLISCAKDNLVKIWDCKKRTCVKTLIENAQNISFVAYQPNLKLFITGYEDGLVK